MVSKYYFLGIVVLLFGCATAGVAEVRELGQRGENSELRKLWARSEKDAMRVAIIEALADHPDEDGLQLTVDASSSGSNDVRRAAMRALARYPGPAALETLVIGLGDPFPAVREQARVSLSSKGEEADAALIAVAGSAQSPLARAAATRLITESAAARPLLREQVSSMLQILARRDDAPQVREEAVSGLGRLGFEEARALLVERMRTDDDPAVRMSAEKALAKLGAAPDSKQVVVAVLPLRSAEPSLERVAEQMGEYIAARLSSAKVCQVVDPEKLERAIAEMKKHGAALYDGDSPAAPEIGRFKMANQLVYGSLHREGLVYTIVLNRMEVSTLQLVPGASATASGYRADLDKLKVEVTDRFLANFR